MIFTRVSKPGQPDLLIHEDAVADHERLGWTVEGEEDFDPPEGVDEEHLDDLDEKSDDELRALIKERDGRTPHPATAREKLLKALRGDKDVAKEIETE